MITRAALAQTLRSSLHDAALAFGEDAEVFDRCVSTALKAYTRLRPHRLQLAVPWSFGGPDHDIPADVQRVAVVQWSDRVVDQWLDTGQLAPPAVLQASIVQVSSGSQLRLAAPLHGKAPRAGTVYVTLHTVHTLPYDDVDETPQTVTDADEDLLLLRAQVEAMRELAARGITKPVTLRDGQSQGPRNGTPASMQGQLLAEFKAQMVS